jgi:glutamate racemase
VPVHGIVDAGVDLFHEALAATPAGAIVLAGTKTTIESGVHRERLVRRGIGAGRVGAASCHGLATAIERGPESAATAGSIETCAARAGDAAPSGQPLYLGLCCTHYGMVADRITAALARRTGRAIVPLDPNERVVRDVMPLLTEGTRRGQIAVQVISKVALSDEQRDGIARILEPISPATADALRHYTRVPDLF